MKQATNSAASLIFGLLLGAAYAQGSDRTVCLEVTLGLVAPSGEAAGDAIRSGARLAREEHESTPGGGQCISVQLLDIPSELPWGRQTEALTGAVYEANAPVLIGAPDPRTAHLVAQIVTRSKGRVLFFSLADDPSLNQIGVPWIFSFFAARTGGEDWNTEAHKRFQGAFFQEFEEAPRPLAALSYDATRVAIDLMTHFGTGPEAIARELHRLDRPGASGRLKFAANGSRKP